MIDLNEKQVKAEERKRKLDAAKAKRKRKEEKKAIKLGLKIPKVDDEEFKAMLEVYHWKKGV